jgi:ribA/ribD-fused uncharacterized protein
MTIDSFKGNYRFLSNFWPAPIELFGLLYATTEHAYQAAKCECFFDSDRIRFATTPGKAKRMGQTVAMRENWDLIKVDIMRLITKLKYVNEDLRELLLSTGDAQLIEGNTWGDTFWGVCDGQGENHLGRILMEVRDSLTLS